MTTDIRFDTYYRYDAITQFLHNWPEKYPDLCRLSSIGKSYQDRDIWLLTITNFDTGPDTEKPAFWIDGNIHSVELSASSAALYLINHLLTHYGSDERVTHALDSRVFYIVPRLNPDGAEWALADDPIYIRSTTRPFPRTDQLDGLIRRDSDGDGRVLQMRIKDPNGAFKPHPEHPRLMILRQPDDLPGGDYYRLLPEGKIQNYDGVTIKLAPRKQGLDMNRNFPVEWTPEQVTGGDYPASEPEIRSAVDFIVKHPNITGAITFHTFSGVHLRPPTKGPESVLPTRDLRTYKTIGRKATELTGYAAISVHEDFAYDPKSYIKGTFDDWMYEHRGVYAWTTEIWSPQQQADLKDYHYIDWMREHSAEDDLKIIRWFEENAPEGYVDWYEYDHPQLGKVELGGWHDIYSWSNPPHKLLEKEIAPLAEFALYQCLISPRLELHSVDVTSNGDTHRIRLVVENTGWLPTNVTEQALNMKIAQPVEVDLELPEGARLLMGELKTFGGQLAGRDHRSALTIWSADVTDNRLKVEWVVAAPSGTTVNLTAQHDRAGVVRTSVVLGNH
ncbi:MAG: M14 family metallopeptidase [Anaerolineae bacterium]|nr:M14 family metallopeptidase [Anaerolineae bacterium]